MTWLKYPFFTITIPVLDVHVLKIRKFARVFFFRETSHMRSFVKVKSLRKGEITLWFTDLGKSCPSSDFLTLQICLLTLLAKITFSQKFPNNSLAANHDKILSAVSSAHPFKTFL